MRSASSFAQTLGSPVLPAEPEKVVRYRILRVDASMPRSGSDCRRVADTLVHRLRERCEISLVSRELSQGVGVVDEDWLRANSMRSGARTEEMRAILSESDVLVSELRAADTLIIATPIHNFSIPSVLKAWIDQVFRSRETFRHTEDGPEGMLTGKRAIVVFMPYATVLRGKADFASEYLRYVLGFLGIKDVTFIEAGQLAGDMRGTAGERAGNVVGISR